MHGKRFVSWAGGSPATKQCLAGAKGSFASWPAIIDGPALRNAGRSFCDRFLAVAFGGIPGSGALGARSCVAPGKRIHIHARPARLWHRPLCLAGQCQPSTRRALGNGGGCFMCRIIRRHRRDLRRSGGSGFHGHQAAGLTLGCFGGSGLSDPRRRSGRVKCGTRTLAGRGTAIAAASIRHAVSGFAAMGCGPVSRTWTHSGSVGCAI